MACTLARMNRMARGVTRMARTPRTLARMTRMTRWLAYKADPMLTLQTQNRLTTALQIICSACK